MFTLAGGAVIYPQAEALDTIRSYALDTRSLAPGTRFPDAFATHKVPAYAYRTYDCVPASPGPLFSDLDLLITAGLNARLDVPAIAALRNFADRAANYLDAAHNQQPDFLLLNRPELGDDPPQGSAGWHLREAWRQGMATPGLDIARVHKALHHKRPRLVPLLDKKTVEPIATAARAARCTLWQLIYDEIHAHAEDFTVLADEFDKIAAREQGVPLSRLRLYDILLWMAMTRPQ
ncbi:DUF6308 family protein [Micromonospora tulbaghiae]|uniref:DUF6308 family protein n=1 Tax=Micromonospora tulbaghiae TaxID=479978 RepID=UPI0034186EE6